MKKISNFKRKIIIVKLLLMNSGRRSNYLKRKKIFYFFGNDVRWATTSIPSEPYLVSIGNHARIAANVTFITHDIIDGLFLEDPTLENYHNSFRFHMDKIMVGDYVMIGANSTILYGVNIGSHSIIAAGSVVTKDVPEGSIVGGAPARVIGNYYDLAEKRSKWKMPTNNDDIDTITKEFWK